MRLALLSIVFISVLFSCSTDIELLAPYDSRTVIYGLLDAQADTQFIKINRTFLGEGDNFTFAQIRDSSEYDFSEFNARVEQWKDGVKQETFPLDSMTIDNKNTDGIWYAPTASIYFFPTPDGLDDDSEYRLFVDFNTGEESIEATTDMVLAQPDNQNIIRPPALNPNFRLGLATTTSSINGVYPDFRFKWNSTEGARRYEVILRLKYIEKLWTDASHTELVSTTPRNFDWFLGTRKTGSLDGGEEFELIVNGETFFNLIQSRIDADPLITREIGIYNGNTEDTPCFDFILTIANEELNTFIDVNEPVTGVIQERPEYTNIVNGVGIFASKATQSVADFQANEGTIAELYGGQYTVGLNFCTPDISPDLTEYFCGN